MVISSAESNSSELQRIAKMTGIQNFMDVAYAISIRNDTFASDF